MKILAWFEENDWSVGQSIQLKKCKLKALFGVGMNLPCKSLVKVDGLDENTFAEFASLTLRGDNSKSWLYIWNSTSETVFG